MSLKKQNAGVRSGFTWFRIETITANLMNTVKKLEVP
jgi:hypothetical protein